MQAVINVIMNRVALQSWYGLNPMAVCKKPYQFSCWNKGDANLLKLLAVNDNDPVFTVARKLAAVAIDGKLNTSNYRADCGLWEGSTGC